MAKEDTWESKENLKNAMELVKEFAREYYREEEEEVRFHTLLILTTGCILIILGNSNSIALLEIIAFTL